MTSNERDEYFLCVLIEEVNNNFKVGEDLLYPYSGNISCDMKKVELALLNKSLNKKPVSYLRKATHEYISRKLEDNNIIDRES